MMAASPPRGMDLNLRQANVIAICRIDRELEPIDLLLGETHFPGGERPIG